MATITAALVKDLREKTGAGMMDCKAALEANDGDVEAAIDWLRKKGLAKAAKKSGRVAAEGLVAVAVRDNRGVVVEVNSETDFVARNEEFQALVRDDRRRRASRRRPMSRRCSARTIRAAAPSRMRSANAIATIGENMTLRRAAELQVAHGVIGQYIHNVSRARPRQDRRDRGAGVDWQGRRTDRRSAARSPCTSPPRARLRSTRPASTRR